MITRTIIRLPQQSANDTDALLTSWLKDNGEWITTGTPLLSAETTKAVFDVDAEADGHITHLVAEGERVPVGAPVAVISSEPETLETIRKWITEQEQAAEEPAPENPHPGMRPATRKAEILAKKMGFDLSSIPAAGERITEADVQAYAARQKKETPVVAVRESARRFLRRDSSKVERLLLAGGGGNAIQIIDALDGSPCQKPVYIMDDNASIHGTSILGVPVIGSISPDKALELLRAGEIDAAVVAIGSVPVRARIFEQWRSAGIPFGTIIHPTVHIGIEAVMGEGNVIMAFGQLGPFSSLGNNNFMSAYTNIEHHCTLGSHCSFGPGIFFSGVVTLGDRVRLGTGIHVEPGLNIGSDTTVASGVTVTGNIPENSLVKSRAGYALRKRSPA